MVTTDDGWLPAPVVRAASPNQDERPAGCSPEVVIVHAISLPPRSYGGSAIEQLFGNRLDPGAHPYFGGICDLAVSAHLLIRRSGGVIQFVSLDRRAWHAGVSECLGRPRVNDFSIGIELEGCDEESFTRVQYSALNRMLGEIRHRYPVIDRSRLFGHSDIAPHRKTDPGPNFRWERVRFESV